MVLSQTHELPDQDRGAQCGPDFGAVWHGMILKHVLHLPHRVNHSAPLAKGLILEKETPIKLQKRRYA